MARILVSDDDEQIQRMYQTILTREGFEVEVANTGALTLDRIRQGQIDLVLLDMMMPGLSGLDVLKELNREPVDPRPKFIVASNIDNPVIIDKAKAENIDGYLIKSNVGPEQVVTYIRQVLAGNGGTTAAPNSTEPSAL